jgi:hypothetical protein
MPLILDNPDFRESTIVGELSKVLAISATAKLFCAQRASAPAGFSMVACTWTEEASMYTSMSSDGSMPVSAACVSLTVVKNELNSIGFDASDTKSTLATVNSTLAFRSAGTDGT